jgi:hypothetical protein
LFIDRKIQESEKNNKPSKVQELMKSVYDRLDEIKNFAPEDPKNRASLRIKILIKNLFDNKASGWLKSKDEDKKI